MVKGHCHKANLSTQATCGCECSDGTLSSRLVLPCWKIAEISALRSWPMLMTIVDHLSHITPIWGFWHCDSLISDDELWLFLWCPSVAKNGRSSDKGQTQQLVMSVSVHCASSILPGSPVLDENNWKHHWKINMTNIRLPIYIVTYHQ